MGSALSTGVVVYEGGSSITGNPIAWIITFHSTNRKTGPCPQGWVLSASTYPAKAAQDAVIEGRLDDVCGKCIAKWTIAKKAGICYAGPNRAPNNVFKAYHKGRYVRPDDKGHGKAMNRFRHYAMAWELWRSDAFGDSAAVPRPVIDDIDLWSGTKPCRYTQRWRELPDVWRHKAMASCWTYLDAIEAHDAGWRSYRACGGHPATPIDMLARERLCPYPRQQCISCKGCTGQPAGKKRIGTSYVTRVHGTGSRAFQEWDSTRHIKVPV